MKTGEAAKILGVDRTTIINWIEHRGLEHFFSNSAAGRDGGTQRTLTESDLVVLNTIRALRSVNSDWREIARLLESGQRETEVPQNAASTDTRTVPVQQAEQSARAMATLAERDAALAQVNDLRAEVHELQAQLAREMAEKSAMKEELLREMAEVRESLLRELGDLQRNAGSAERLENDLAERNAVVARMSKEIGELNRQIGKLEGQLEIYRENRND